MTTINAICKNGKHCQIRVLASCYCIVGLIDKEAIKWTYKGINEKDPELNLIIDDNLNNLIEHEKAKLKVCRVISRVSEDSIDEALTKISF